MKKGYLSDYFDGVAAKRLSAVEADLFRSNQHEFNGVESLKRILGNATGKQQFPTIFLYLEDDEGPVKEEGYMTWYDAREAHPTRSEHRLYFPETAVSQHATEGDVLIIGKRPDGHLLSMITKGGSTVARQVLWLFGLSDLSQRGFAVRDKLEGDRDRIEFAARAILETIGVAVEQEDESFLDDILTRYGGDFPDTREFSKYARSTLDDLQPHDDPDAVLLAWLDREETLFRTLEKHIVSIRLKQGFTDDVEGFISYSLSVQNRRKSRAGLALENHLEAIFKGLNIDCDRGAVTENRSRPDFLFPGAGAYHDPLFQDDLLTMLGAKSTCKDRWRQVLTEAKRIPVKHLLTVEAAISTAQTDEMKSHGLQLVVPEAISHTYSEEQKKWLLSLSSFCELVSYRQGR